MPERRTLLPPDEKKPEGAAKMNRRKSDPSSRRMNRLKDEVYREMFLLEARRPGAEMGLALALLRAWVSSGAPAEKDKDWSWLRTVCPICLKMIEESLEHGSTVAAMLMKTCDSRLVF
jgi:hypothetical protein